MELMEANGIEDFKFLYELETDPEIIYYYHPNFSEDGKMEFLSYDKAMKEYENQILGAEEKIGKLKIQSTARMACCECVISGIVRFILS